MSLTRENVETILPLTPLQEGILFHYTVSPDTDQYLVKLSLIIHQEVSLPVFRSAWEQVSLQHEMLRAVFRWKELGSPVQIIQKQCSPDITFLDTSASELDVQKLCSKRFDLEEATWRILLIRRGANSYEMILQNHHIIYDGWSAGIILKDFISAYAAYAGGNTPATISGTGFRDYLKAAGQQDKAAAGSYWRQYLHGFDGASKLPLQGKPAVQGNGCRKLIFNSADQTRIAAFARQHQLTMAALLYTAWGILLQRYCGSNDVLFGTVVSGRSLAVSGLEEAVGLFINTVPLRVYSAADETISHLLDRVQHNLIQRSRYETTALTDIKHYAHLPGAGDIFDHIFVVENYPIDKVVTANKLLPLSLKDYTEQTSYVLNISAFPDADNMEVVFRYDASVLEESMVQRISGHFRNIIQQLIISTPGQRLSELNMLDTAERDLLLNVFNPTTLTIPSEKTVIDLFEEQAARTPAHTAILWRGETVTYDELNMRSNRLSHYLQSEGVGNGSLVPVCMERSVDMIVAVLGILKTGAAYVPVDPAYPADRILLILEDISGPLVLVDEHHNIPATDTRLVSLGACSAFPVADPRRTSGGDPLISIIYTSGSSGTPKGVQLLNSAILNRLYWMWDLYPFASGERFALKTSLGFVDHIWELFGPLLQGIPSVLFNNDDILDIDRFLQHLSEHRITRIVLVPSLLRYILGRLEAGQLDLSVLQYWTSSGEELTADLVKAFYAHFSPSTHKLLNIYGSTEVAADVTCYDTSLLAAQPDSEVVPIGRPIANAAVYITDQAGDLCPVGVPGELLVKGLPVSPGYYKRSELTHERFITDPFSDQQEQHVFRTGDLAFWQADGNLVYLGRKDNQVKLRGYRIEPGEVERVLEQAPGIRQAVVIARGESSNRYLTGYVTSDDSFDKTALQTFLRAKLPEYMVPSVIVRLPQIPLTPNGKTDRRSLALLNTDHGDEHTYIAPEGETALRLADIWKHLLKKDRIGVTDNFFELGGHSLLATRMVSAIRKQLGREVAVRDIFNMPVIRELARYLDNPGSAGITTLSDLPGIIAGARPERIPLSFSQERLWFIDQLQGSREYHIPGVFRLHGQVNVDALRYGLQQVINRHEVLRSVLKSEHDQTWQEVLPEDQWELVYHEVAASAISDQIREAVAMPFDLGRDHMLRAHLIREPGGDHLLVIVLHHIASDGWSLPILVREFVAYYRSYEQGSAAVLPALSIQYADYAIWQRRYLDGDGLATALSYWEERLSGSQPLELPTNHTRPAQQSGRGATIHYVLPAALQSSLELLSRQEEVTLFMTLLSVFKVLLYRYSGQHDISIGSPVANRQRAEVEGLIGFFVNTLVLRSEVHGEMSYRDYLRQLRQITLAAYEHQDAPFEKVVEAVVRDRDLSRHPLFQVMFMLQNNESAGITEHMLGEGLSLHAEPVEGNSTKFDLSVALTASSAGLNIDITYSTDLFEAGTVSRMLSHYEQLLQAVVSNPASAIGKLEILGVVEKQLLLQGFNDTKTAYATEKTLVDVFEAQVARTPDQVAIVSGECMLTYRELDEYANRLSHYLQTKYSVGPEVLVGISQERSEWQVISILGIMKAGAAYVPVDPSYPQERIRYILSDSDLRVLLDEAALSQFREELLFYPVKAPSRALQPGNMAYVIYTSGSTGNPKGVMVEHGSVVNYISSQSRYLGITQEDNILQLSGLSFDASVEQIFIALLNGARLTMISNELLLSAGLLEAFIDEQQITHIHSVPSLLKLITARKYPSLKRVISAGESCDQRLADSWAAYHDFYNKYGPTEATISATIYHYKKDNTGPVLPIGKPVANTRLYVLDERRQLLPIGIPGELYIGGVGVSRGYLGKEALTAERFIADPFVEGGRLYRTGDWCKWQADGNLVYTGRRDNQVKLRGQRIELEEIERVLEQAPGVGQAVVLVKGEGLNRYLSAYIVSEGIFDKGALQAYLRTQLPDYMVPAVLTALEQLPLTPNGKIDRRSLSLLEVAFTDQAYEAPQNSIEAQLAAIWERLLKIEQVSVTSNFFELGGHSLLATRVVSAIRQALSQEVFIRDLFSYPTIRSLGAHIGAGSSLPALPVITAGERPQRLPLSYTQERLWFIDQLQGSREYHIPGVFRLQGAVNVDALRYGLQQVINRHEVLRSVLKSEHDQRWQEVLPEDQWELVYHNENIPGIAELVQEIIRESFDLKQDHMLRAHLIRESGGDHLLVLVLHHIAADGWSMPVLLREFVAYYHSYEQGSAANLPVLPVQYADYAIWQRRYISGELLSAQLSYWQQQLSGAEALELPTDHVRPAQQSGRGATIHYVLPAALQSSLELLSRQEGVTMFMTLLSVFKVLLYRYSGQEDISIGSPVANRQQAEVEGLIGFFVNTLVLRSEVHGDMSYRDYLRQLRQITLEAYEHQSAPFEKVVEAVVRDRDMSRHPLFQVMFILQNNESVGLQENILGAGLSLQSVVVENNSTQFDLSFSLRESPEGLELNVTYSTDLFTPATIQRLCTYYEQLLSSVVNDPTATIGLLQLLSTEEEELLLNTFNATDTVYPADQTVADLFALQVARTPDNIAVTFESQSLSYRELDAASNQVANYLRSQGIGPGSLVPVCLDRSLEMIIGLLGILKSGGAYVPIDPEYPLERIRYILSDIGAALLLVNKNSQAGLSALSEVTLVSLDGGLMQEHSTNSLNSRPSVQDLCYVIYTSGTTGRPKGVMVGHQGLTNRLCWGQQRYGLDVSDTVLQKTTFCFDVSVWELFWPLISGARLLFARVGGHKDPAYLKQLIASEGVTVLHFVPSMLEVFLQELGAGDCAGVQHVFCSGEALGATQVRALHRQLPAAKLHNLYGPTEATIEVSYWDAEGEDVGVVPIGRPVANTQLYVLDAAQRLAPLGGIGELYIGGVQVAGGYLHQPELSVSHFIADRFRGAGRLYRTGDLVRWQADGQLLYLGRKDSQVKLRGYRIELGEVERVLEQAPGIRQAVVLLRGSSAEGYLAAYVVVDEQYERALVESYIRSRVPSYMVPAAIVSMDQLPLTGSGKVDRRRLAALDSTVITGSYEAPESSMESALVAIWQELLKKDRIGVTDNFFELGGHSLLATRVVSRIRRDLGREVSIRDLFTHPTVRSLAGQLTMNAGEVLQPGIIAGARPERIPLSFSQERLWFIDQLQGSREYHIPGVFRLKGAVNVDALRYGLQQVINRHEVLRSVLKSEHDQTWQEVLPEDQWELVYHNENIPGIAELVQEIIRESFNLKKDHMLRAHLIREPGGDHLLVIVLHHIASDGWSLPILVREFVAYYRSYEQGSAAVLPALSIQYADYAIWQRRYLDGDGLATALSYWEERLSGSQPLELHTDHTRPAQQSGRGATIHYVLPAALQSSLELLSRQEGVTLFMTLLSVFKVLLFRYSGQHDISIGSPVANRQRAEVEGLIGFFVNTLVLRSEVRSDMSYRDYLRQLRQITLEAYDHQDAPFEKMVEAVVRDRDLSRHPLFQVMFMLQNNESAGITEHMLGEGLSLHAEPVEGNSTKFDLSVALSASSAGLNIDITYSTDLFEAGTVSRMLSHYEQLLQAVVSNPASAIEKLNMLDAAEHTLLLDTFNDTKTAYATGKTLVDVFEAQVARTPEQVAIVSGDRMLTYRELDEYANRLSHYLQTKYNVGPEVLVGISQERSEWQVISILGIMKAGAAYVPVDPSYPQERIRYILSDSDLRVLLDEAALSQFREELLSYPVKAPSRALQPGNMAYVIYTSGSTGNPKGVMVEHGSVVNYISSQSRYLGITQEDNILQLSGLSFDASVEQIFIALLNGARLTMISNELLLSAGLLEAFIDEQQITHIHGVPSLLKLITARKYPSLKRVISAGESCDQRLADSWAAYHDFYNKYGPTEATISATIYHYKKDNTGPVLPIGKPVANTRLYVLDERQQLLPIGISGELYIGGVGVSRGYLGKDALTAERFIADPFVEGGRLYRTGDWCKWQADGNLVYTGRRDNQVKLRGQRIELEEIERVLKQAPGVGQAVVLVKGEELNRYLSAYIVSEGDFDKHAVQAYLRTQLPDYMVPAVLTALEQLPLTPNGKIDRKTLALIDTSPVSSHYKPPGSDTEQQLAEIWQRLLKTERISITSNFFESGGHSLMGMKVLADINKVFHTELSIKVLFQFPTIEKLAEYIDTICIDTDVADQTNFEVFEL